MITSFLSSIPSIIASLLGITAIIIFHEFGHFIFCKLFNVYTPTFSIGMGNILYSKQIGQTKFCLSAAPIGGYVEIATDKGIKGTLGFDEIPYYQKVLIMLGGILCNFLLTYLIFFGLFFTGMPESGMPYETNTTNIQQVKPSSINAIHLQSSDEILAINNIDTNKDASVIKKQLIHAIKSGEKQILASIQRNGQHISTQLNISTNQPHTLSNMLDASFEKKPALGLIASLQEAYKTTTYCLSAIIQGLKGLMSSQPTKGFVGPIMAVAISSKSAQKGLSHLLLLLAIISINLGFMNLLPLPIFDGGQFVMFTIESITRKKLSEKVRNIIGISSWVFALSLMIIFSLKDIYALVF